LKENGIKYELVNPKNTSKICSKCGAVNETFTFEDRKAHRFLFKCNKCKFEADADYNAALNISKA
jgi:transposase